MKRDRSQIGSRVRDEEMWSEIGGWSKIRRSGMEGHDERWGARSEMEGHGKRWGVR